MKATAILETVLYADDLDAAEDFYARVFGLEVLRKEAGRFVFFRLAGAMLLIFAPAASARQDAGNPIPRHGARGPGHLCFRAEGPAAIAAWAERLAALGIAIEADHLWPTGARSLYIRDPAGNSVEIGEPAMWGL
jgi:catechol 2,3-dioxygenase-like lactoylglutathione lyase family enzyme